MMFLRIKMDKIGRLALRVRAAEALHALASNGSFWQAVKFVPSESARLERQVLCWRIKMLG